MKKNYPEIDQYEIDVLCRDNYSPHTRTSYLRSLQDFFNFKKKRPIDRDLYRAYHAHVASLNLSVKSKNLHLVAVRSYLSYLNRHEDNVPPFKDILKSFRNLAGKDNHLNLPDQETLATFLLGVKQKHYPTFVLANIMLYSGLRVSEALSLSVGKYNDTFTIIGKGAKQRPAVAPPHAVALVREYEKTLPADQKKLFTFGVSYPQFVFRELTRGTITPHTLRHIFATQMLENNLPITVVQKLLGHSSINTTQIYAHVTDAFMVQAYKQSLSSAG